MTRLPSEISPQESSPLLDSECSRDGFWDALSSNYTYLMDGGLVAQCREALGELAEEDERTFRRFVEHFEWLHDLLHNLQVATEGDSKEKSQKTVVERIARPSDEPCESRPDLRDEVNGRLDNKRRAVLNSSTADSPSRDATAEIRSRMHNLRALESRIDPSANKCSEGDISDMLQQQHALQKDIEGKGKCVWVLLQLCERLKGRVRFGQSTAWDADRVRRVATNLQRRWHLLWLHSLERLCTLEEMMMNSKTGCGNLDESFSEGPLKKYPKLSEGYEVAIKGNAAVTSRHNNHSRAATSPLNGKTTAKADKSVMVGTTGIAELKAGRGGKFEITVRDVGYSSETSAYLSTDDKTDFTVKNSLRDRQDNAPCKTRSPPVESSPIIKHPSLSLNEWREDCCLLHSILHAPDEYPYVSPKALSLLQELEVIPTCKHSGTLKNTPKALHRVAYIVDEENAPKNPRAALEKGKAKNLSKSTERDVHQTSLKQKPKKLPSRNKDFPFSDISNLRLPLGNKTDVKSSDNRLRPFFKVASDVSSDNCGTLQCAPTVNVSADSSIKSEKVADVQSGQLQGVELRVSAEILRRNSRRGAIVLGRASYQEWAHELNCTQLTKLQSLKSGRSESTEEDVSEDLDTVVPWQLVQVGNSLPMTEVLIEDLHSSTAAEVRLSDCHDILFEFNEGKGEKQRAHVDVEKATIDTKSGSIKRDGVSGLRRFLRVSFTILLILYCLLCHIEPQNMSMLPRLRYPNSPPPV